jgi:F-type H+-transporting ATPase subunit b
VDIDATVLVQLAVFLVMFLILRLLLFRPVLRLIEARREATLGVQKRAAEVLAEAEGLATDLERQLLDVRTAAGGERERMLDQARQQERKVIVALRDECRTLVTQASARAEEDFQEVRQQLRANVPQLARFVSSRILGRSLKGDG